MSEYDRLKAQKDAIALRNREQIENETAEVIAKWHDMEAEKCDAKATASTDNKNLYDVWKRRADYHRWDATNIRSGKWKIRP